MATHASLCRRGGQTLTEYGLLVALIAIIVIAILVNVGNGLSGLFGGVTSTVNGPGGSGSGPTSCEGNTPIIEITSFSATENGEQMDLEATVQVTDDRCEGFYVAVTALSGTFTYPDDGTWEGTWMGGQEAYDDHNVAVSMSVSCSDLASGNGGTFRAELYDYSDNSSLSSWDTRVISPCPNFTGGGGATTSANLTVNSATNNGDGTWDLAITADMVGGSEGVWDFMFTYNDSGSAALPAGQFLSQSARSLTTTLTVEEMCLSPETTSLSVEIIGPDGQPAWASYPLDICL